MDGWMNALWTNVNLMNDYKDGWLNAQNRWFNREKKKDVRDELMHQC